jgi:hypothetical protein
MLEVAMMLVVRATLLGRRIPIVISVRMKLALEFCTMALASHERI